MLVEELNSWSFLFSFFLLSSNQPYNYYFYSNLNTSVNDVFVKNLFVWFIFFLHRILDSYKKLAHCYPQPPLKYSCLSFFLENNLSSIYFFQTLMLLYFEDIEHHLNLTNLLTNLNLKQYRKLDKPAKLIIYIIQSRWFYVNSNKIKKTMNQRVVHQIII